MSVFSGLDVKGRLDQIQNMAATDVPAAFAQLGDLVQQLSAAGEALEKDLSAQLSAALDKVAGMEHQTFVDARNLVNGATLTFGPFTFSGSIKLDLPDLSKKDDSHL